MVLKVFCRTMSADNRVCAERFIRPLVGERKHSLFFGSDKMEMCIRDRYMTDGMMKNSFLYRV